MSALSDVARNEQPSDQEELPRELADCSLTTSAGKPEPAQICWGVVLPTDGNQIRHDICSGRDARNPDSKHREPEGIIWLTWPVGKSASSDSPLAGMKECRSRADGRLRDSAKWMGAVLGAALAAVVGASLLTAIREHRPAGTAIALGLGGFVLLGITLFLVLQVMRPQPVSYTEIQKARKGWGSPRSALSRWRETVELYEDLYLLRGIRDLTSLRPSMIIEELPCWPWLRRAGTSRAIKPTDGFGSLRPHTQPDCVNFTSQQHRSRRSGTTASFGHEAHRTGCRPKWRRPDRQRGHHGSFHLVPWPKQKLELQHARPAAMSGQCGCCAITRKHTVLTIRYRRKGRYAAWQDAMPSKPADSPAIVDH